MSTRAASWVALVVGLGLVAGLRAAETAAVPRQDQDVLSALLAEVHALRIAMERMATATPRVQLALGRLQLQEQRVNTMVRRHDDTRERIASEETQAAQMKDEVARLEDVLRRETDPARRDDEENQVKMIKAMLDRTAAEIQRLRAEEASLAQAVATEQGRWVDINAQLEALEQTLVKR
jgi:chromosome segregation ATPase